MQPKSIVLSQTDYENLNELLARLSSRRLPQVEALENELAGAQIVGEEDLPKTVVTLNSSVEYEDLATGKTKRVQITLPEDADISRGRISVLAPVGSALLGLAVGQSIEWPLPGGRKTELRIRRVLAPEAVEEEAGAYSRKAS